MRNEILNGKQFLRACEKGDVEKVKLGLGAGIPVDLTDKYGLSALILAARKGQIETAKILIEAGADINFEDVTKRTPLFHAVCFNKIEMVQVLAKQGATIDVIDMHGWSPCKMAESKYNEKLVELLMSLGAKTCSPENMFIEINIGLDGLRAKLVNSTRLANFWVQKVRKELDGIEIEKLKGELDAVCVILVVGLDMPVQPVDLGDRALATDVGIPDIDSDDQMRDCVYSALSDGFFAIADYLESHFGESIDFEKFRSEIKSAFERLSE